MGNDSSVLKECAIDETPIYKNGTEFSLHHAQRIEDKCQLSVFISKDHVGDRKNLLEMMGKNLKLYRHPFIVRYVDYCETSDAIYLFTEKASPLSVVLKQQSYLQICLGLQNIIQALSFLHDVGLACHNNVCQSAILVTPEGRWKLGGLEFVTKFDCMSQSFLETSHSFRYEKGISPEEKSSSAFKDHRKRDIFSLGVLIEEILATFLVENAKADDPNVEAEARSFLEFTKKKLQSEASDIRPSLSDLLAHPFFNKDYLNIVAFLTDLPLKSNSARKDFFCGLTQKLFSLPEKVVSGQLAPLLLSRMVLLDQTAAQIFIPNMMTPAKGNRTYFSAEKLVNPILSERHFQDDIIPILLKIFLVRDVQIRSVLLRHFTGYCHLFHQILLEEEVLPQLLLGIRDSNDTLVADSLRALADVVPLLGASKVIGKNRRKLFANGYPGKVVASTDSFSSSSSTSGKLSTSNTAAATERAEARRLDIQQKREERKLQMEMKKKEKERSISPDRSHSPETERGLSQRCSPIGAETSDSDNDETKLDEKRFDENKFDQNSIGVDEWDDWDVAASPAPSPEVFIEFENIDTKKIEKSEMLLTVVKLSTSPVKRTVVDMDDLSKLDIKMSVSRNADSSADFFADMTPVISEAPKFDASKQSKFDIVASTAVEAEGEGWEGDGWD